MLTAPAESPGFGVSVGPCSEISCAEGMRTRIVSLKSEGTCSTRKRSSSASESADRKLLSVDLAVTNHDDTTLGSARRSGSVSHRQVCPRTGRYTRSLPGTGQLPSLPAQTGPERCRMCRRKARSDDSPRGTCIPSIQDEEFPLAQWRAGHRQLDGKSLRIDERRRDIELLSDDFRCYRTSNTGGSLHVIRGSRPRHPRVENSSAMQQPGLIRHRWISRCLRDPKMFAHGAGGGAPAVGKAEATEPRRHCEDHRGPFQDANVKRARSPHTPRCCKCLAGLAGDSNLKLPASNALPNHGFEWR